MRERLFPIEIPKRSRHCAESAETFLPGSEYYSILIDKEEENWERMDFCLRCWAEAKQKWSEKVHTHWKSQIPPEQTKADLNKSRNEKALELLREAIQADTSDEHAEAFILALYLVRCRVLALRQQLVREGVKIGLYEVIATEEMLPVRLLPLSQLQVNKLQEQLAKKLG